MKVTKEVKAFIVWLNLVGFTYDEYKGVGKYTRWFRNPTMRNFSLITVKFTETSIQVRSSKSIPTKSFKYIDKATYYIQELINAHDTTA